MSQNQHTPLIEEALHWLVLLREDATPQSRAAFDAWLATGPEHQAAWQRAQHVWQRADILEPALRSEAAADAAAIIPMPARRVASRWAPLAAAACLLLALTGYVAISAGLLADHRTATAEQRGVRLADGSQLQLGSATALSVEISAGARIVTLHKGEAHFAVAADAARPFIVRAAGGETRALGTAFDVKTLSNGGAVVTVTEHAVAVTAPDGQTARAGEGQQVRYGSSGISEAHAVDVSAATAWRRNRLVFYDAPLAEVVADLERHRAGRILITDERLKALPVTAVFDTAQTDAAIETIARSLPVKLRQFGPLLAVISPAE